MPIAYKILQNLYPEF